MTVPLQTPNITYTANGITTSFAFPFRADLATDITVQISGAAVTTYTVDGLGDDEGSVTFASPPPDGAPVYIARSIPLERVNTDYQFNGDLRAATINDDFDRLWMVLQQMGFVIGLADPTLARALLLGTGDVIGSGSYRAGGNRIQNLGTPLADTDAATLGSARDIAEEITSGVAGALGTFIQNGVNAIVRTFQDKMRDDVSIKDFGCVGDASDETAKVQNALNAAVGKRLLLGEALTYGITSINIPNDVTIVSNGSKFRKLAASNTWAITGGLRLVTDRLWLATVGGPTDAGINLSAGGMQIGSIRVESDAVDSGTTNSSGPSASFINGLLIGPDSGSAVLDQIGTIYVSQFCRPVVFRNMRQARIGTILINQFRRGVYVLDCQDSDFGDAAISGLSPSSQGVPGDNGLLVEASTDGSTSNIHIGKWSVTDSGEHGFRLGGTAPIRGFWADDLHALRPGAGSAATGGSGFKALGSSSTSYHFNVFVNNLLVEDGNPGGGNFCGLQVGLVDGGQFNNLIVRARDTQYSTYHGVSMISTKNVTISNPTVKDTFNYAARFYTAVSAGFPNGSSDTVIEGGLLQKGGTSMFPAVAFEGDAGPADAAMVRCGLKGVRVLGGNVAVQAQSVTGAGAYTECFLDFAYTASLGAGGIMLGTDAFFCTIVADALNSSTPALDGSSQRVVGGRLYSKEFGKWQAPTESFTVTIANNAAISWTPPNTHGFVAVSLPSTSQNGMAWMRSTASPASVKYFGGANFSVLNSALSGTTGTAGNVTLGTQTGTLYLENQSGSSQQFVVTQLG